ncbi:MAG: efflux RND transporter periplasmic adaptor subunit [Cyanobacteriota bacterium]|jgi:RND family efflux transporter MFP subunit|nr:efflux RND transporter periplasmic adaptor subunit [Cyanobacteriota bacterium]
MRVVPTKPLRSLLAAVLSTTLLVGCRQAAESRRIPTVLIEPVGQEVFSETIETIGTLEARDEVELAAQAGGRVQQVLVRQGDRVRRGQLLLVLDQTQLRAEVASLRAQMETSKLNYERYAYLVQAGAASAIDRDQYRQAYVAARQALVARQADLAFKDLRAPIDGTLGDLRVKDGDVVAAGAPLAVLLRNDRLVVRLDVPASQAMRVRDGLSVVLLDASGRQLARALVIGVDPNVSSDSQVLLVRAALSDRGPRLRSGMRLRARLLLDRRQLPAVPFPAVITLAGQSFVYRVGDLEALKRQPGQAPLAALQRLPAGSRFALQTPVRLGPLQNNRYPVLSGVTPGQPVIISGVLNLRHGAPVKVAEELAR